MSASQHWERAIEAAQSGRRDEALREFGLAIEMDPDYYVSVIQPSSAVARALWHEAVKAYVGKADAKAADARVATGQCHRCGTSIGTQWHYPFESIVMASQVGVQCPDCGLVLCDEHVEYGADGNFILCPNCGGKFVYLSEGPAYSSLVESAWRERRYRGAIKDPSVLGRPVQKG